MAKAQALVLMVVHAHPGPESTNTGGILAHYARQGVRVVLVTCTGGEPAAARLAELRAACAHLGVHHLELLGYQDSGMAGEPRADAFRDVPVDEVADRLAALMQQHRPQVVVTYDPEVHYHPDHVHAAVATHRAAERTGIPAKVYSVALGAAYWAGIHAAAEQAGLGDAFAKPVATAENRRVDDRITTSVDVAQVWERKQVAVLAHASQVGGTWIEKLYRGPMPAILGSETYIRTWDRSGAPLPDRDLFDGLRTAGAGRAATT
ncbi:PIG-L family deacetylase [Actinoplanes sp. NPDC051859]|uniref:PIG-L family deacetylase n=1 Tax=Actinoplanes sp. NPDC051859 TaxID=3363909 RepID=UPI00378DB8B8